MSKPDLKRLALLGLSSGILAIHSLSAAENKDKKSESTKSDKGNSDESNDGNLGYHVMTEDELLLELDSEGTAMYKKLDADGKGLALLVASARCNQTNPCKGLNACKTDKNECAGKGQCKGTGKCATSDKNLAVKMVYDKMAGKRNKANTPSQ